MTKTQIDDKLVVVQKGSKDLIERVNDLTIKDEHGVKMATELLAEITKQLKTLEETRLFFTKPLNDQLTSINARFRPIKEFLQKAQSLGKLKVVNFRKVQEEKLEAERKKEEDRKRKEWEKDQEKLRKQREKEAEKERKRLEKEGLKGKAKKEELQRIEDEQKAKEEEASREEFSFDDTDFKQQKSVHSDNGSLKMRKQWNFKVVEPQQVPKKYLVIDEKLIRADIRAGVRNIKGIDIFEEEIVGVSV
ncbi:MAG: hypothetical protein EOL88_00660 [Bacteroidia bacterium]|nr:hypothetical protein [Bacteroidia bacterium]